MNDYGSGQYHYIDGRWITYNAGDLWEGEAPSWEDLVGVDGVDTIRLAGTEDDDIEGAVLVHRVVEGGRAAQRGFLFYVSVWNGSSEWAGFWCRSFLEVVACATFLRPILPAWDTDLSVIRGILGKAFTVWHGHRDYDGCQECDPKVRG